MRTSRASKLSWAERSKALALGAKLALGAIALASVLTASSAAVSGCASQRTVVLKLHGAEADALVTINDRYVDRLETLSRRGIALPPGTYRVTVEKVGFFPWDELVEIDEQPVERQVELTRIPD
jgi:hypothetical protein